MTTSPPPPPREEPATAPPGDAEHPRTARDRRVRALQDAALAVVHAAETGTTRALGRFARARGWTPALLTHSGYAGPEGARLQGRVLLAPPGRDLAARRGLPGWRQLLTLELRGATAEVGVGGATTTATSDGSGLIDVVLDVELPPGTAQGRFSVPGRPAVPVDVHVTGRDGDLGVICDIDDTAWITGLSHPLRAAWRTFARAGTGRRAVPGMAALLARVVEDPTTSAHPAVFYVSNGPWNLAGPVSRFLDRHGFPPGALQMTDWGTSRDRWFRDGRAHKATTMRRLSEDLPWVRWVLVGDTGEHDPDLYEDFAAEHPDRVVAIALRDVAPTARPASRTTDAGVPVVRGGDGRALLPLLDAVLAARAADRRAGGRPPAGRPAPR